jgi:MFS family permease
VKGHPFVSVIRTPGVARILVCWLLAFMPVGMNSLATVLTMREYRYSFAAAGAVVGVYLAGMAAVSPLAGRLMDRAGLGRVLIPCAVGYASGIGLLLVLASRHAPLAALGAAALITGAVFPRVTSALRVRCAEVMPRPGYGIRPTCSRPRSAKPGLSSAPSWRPCWRARSGPRPP